MSHVDFVPARNSNVATDVDHVPAETGNVPPHSGRVAAHVGHVPADTGDRARKPRGGHVFCFKDRDAFAALKEITGYAPANPVYTVAEIQRTQTTLVEKRDLEAQAQAALDAARDDATAAEWTFHNKVLGAKDQVKAQFGGNSNEYQAMGRTKDSERKSPSRRGVTPVAQPSGVN